jgi:hypothetical protein
MLGLDLSAGDATFNFSEVIIWSLVEINCGLICACLPSLRPAIRVLGLGRFFGATGRRSDLAKTPNPDIDDELRPYRRQSRKGVGMFSISAADPATRKSSDDEDSYEMIEKSKNQAGVTVTSVEPTKSRISEDRVQRNNLAIEVQRDWTITGEPVVARSGM